MEYPTRKHPRLNNFDYSNVGAYFITICTKNRQRILCSIASVGRDDLGTPPYSIELTQWGEIADKYINSISANYKNVSVDKYVIMPDHIHLLLSLADDKRRAGSSRPTDISTIIGALKRLISKEIGENIFQASFNDHIIRNENDYLTRWTYIENNPLKLL